MTRGTVGIIANPAAGKDVRRLAAYGRTIGSYEKVGMVLRVLRALDAVGVERVLLMPDPSQIARRALEESQLALRAEVLAMDMHADERDSGHAAARMRDAGANCIVTLGGDGTNRVVSVGCGDVPLVPISTGTNNVFPTMVEPTSAGLAAGLVATGAVDLARVSAVQKRLDVSLEGATDEVALIDVAASREPAIGTRAIWDIATVSELVLACAEPSAIGLSAIGAQLHELDRNTPGALYVRLGANGTRVLAPIAPGIVSWVPVAEWRLLESGERVRLHAAGGTVALDGERQFTVPAGATVEVGVSPHGPRVVDVPRTLHEAARTGALRDGREP